MGSRIKGPISTREVTFIERASLAHSGKYSYHLVNYVNDSTKVTVVCPEHGSFDVRPGDHVRKKSGCPSCAGVKKLTTSEFIAKAMAVHGSAYTYERTVYVNATTPVLVTCPIHGDFSITPTTHANMKVGCAACSDTSVSRDQFLDRAHIKHETTYDYSQVKYVNFATPIDIVCPTHGVFTQLPSEHVGYHATGCPTCGVIIGQQKREAIMLEKYGTEHIRHVPGVNEKITATVQKRYGVEHTSQRHLSPESLSLLHDPDWLRHQHLVEKRTWSDIAASLGAHPSTGQMLAARYGIPVQRFMSSTGEGEVAEFIESLGVEVERNNRSIVRPKEIDIYVPSAKIAVEYCGLYWHNEDRVGSTYHAHKQRECASAGVQLITLFEDEWRNRRPQVERKLRHLLGVSNAERISARSTTRVVLDDASDFYDNHHIQGSAPATVTYALTLKGVTVACASFVYYSNKGEWVLVRYATSAHVVGGLSKLISHFKHNHTGNVLTSFADLRWSNGNMYQASGWKLIDTIPPDYYWCKHGVRHHKFGFRHAQLNRKLEHYDPALSEAQNCINHGYTRIYDCGKLKFQLSLRS